MPAPDEQGNINALADLLSAKGLDASDFIDVINALSNIKKRDAEKQEKDAAAEEEAGLKIFVDKEFLFPTRQDCFIYRDGRTKSGRYYIRIYDERTKKVFSQSLKTTNRIEALASAEKIYVENKGKLRKGVKLTSITTKELIGIYLRTRFKERTKIPHAGITNESYDNLIKKLKYWELYIEAKKHKKTKLEDIPTELAVGFGMWVKELPKQFYKGQERSNQTINSYIAAVKKMYRDIAITEKYITMAEFPQFKYLKVPKDNAPKRDILEQEEFNKLRKWMENTWCREKDIDELERTKRRVYGLYLTIQYYAGFRNKEILGLRWKDITHIKTESKEAQRVNRAMFIPADNAKTGKSRICVAPVAYQFERIQAHYKKLGIPTGKDAPNDFIFINLAKTKRGTNTPYEQPAMERRLKAVLEGSGLKEELEKTGRHVTQYSARHYAITDALMRGVSIYDIAINCGTSVHYIEDTYSKVISSMRSEEITKGQGYHQVLKERKEKRDAAEGAIREALGDNKNTRIGRG